MTTTAALRGDVVVVTFNAAAVVRPCLAALWDDLPPGWTITVADNGSSDGTTALVRREFPGVRLVELPSNPGFTAANNAGARDGRGDVVVLVNPDAYIAPGCLRALVEPLERDPRIGLVAGMTLRPGTDIVDSFGVTVDAALIPHKRGQGAPPDPDPRGTLLGPEGCLAAYRREAWDAVGGHDERIFVYGEDIDIALRIRAYGWRAAAAPQARAVHLVSATIGSDSPRQQQWSSFTRGLLLRRYGVLRTTAAPRAMAQLGIAVAHGLRRHRSWQPLRSIVAGWRGAGPQRLAPDPAAIDHSIRLGEALRGLAQAR